MTSARTSPTSTATATPGGAHVHVLAARCDLETGRSSNIAPPGWRRTYDPLRDAFNHEHGWSRPDDPARARVQHPGHRAYVEAARLRTGLGLESEPRDLIRDYLLQRVEHGTLRNRFDVVAALREAGLEVPRQGKDYLTARDPDSGQRCKPAVCMAPPAPSYLLAGTSNPNLNLVPHLNRAP